MICSLFDKIIQFLSLNVLGALCVREKVFNIILGTFFTRKRYNSRDRAPLKLSHILVMDFTPTWEFEQIRPHAFRFVVLLFLSHFFVPFFLLWFGIGDNLYSQL